MVDYCRVGSIVQPGIAPEDPLWAEMKRATEIVGAVVTGTTCPAPLPVQAGGEIIPVTESISSCAGPVLQVRGGRVVTTSRDVAVFFEKEHRHILRDIKVLKISPDLDTSFFIASTTFDAYQRPQPGFEITRDGFALLAMGFTGAKALKFKLAFIAEFNRMEAELRTPAANLHDPATLRTLLLASSEREMAQQAVITVLEPKAAALDRIASTYLVSLLLYDVYNFRIRYVRQYAPYAEGSARARASHVRTWARLESPPSTHQPHFG